MLLRPVEPRGNDWKETLNTLLNTNIPMDQPQLLQQQARIKQISDFNNSMNKAQRLLYQCYKAQKKQYQSTIQSLQQQLAICQGHIEIQDKHKETLKDIIATLETESGARKQKPKLDQLQTAEQIKLNNQLIVLDSQFQNLLKAEHKGLGSENFLFSEIYKHPDIKISDDGTKINSHSYQDFDVFATANHRLLFAQPSYNVDTLKYCCCQPYISSNKAINIFFEISEIGKKFSIGIASEGCLALQNGDNSYVNEYYLVDQNGLFCFYNQEEGDQQIYSSQFKLEKNDVVMIHVDIQNQKISWTKNPQDEINKENISFEVKIKEKMYPIIGIQEGEINIVKEKKRGHYI